MGTSKNQEAASGAAVKKRGQFKEIWRRLKKNKMAMIFWHVSFTDQEYP